MDRSRYDTVLDYAIMYKEFMNTEMTIEKESELQFKRNNLIEYQGSEIVVVLEKIIDYEKFGGTDEFIRFVKDTKSLILSVVKSPSKSRMLLKTWEDKNPMDLYREPDKPSKCFSNWTMAILSLYVYEYLETT